MPLHAAWKEGVMEALAGWLKGDLPEIGRGGRHAAVNAVIDGGFVSVLHVYDLVIIAESKKLYPSKQKALYAWLYILIGGQDPRSLAGGCNPSIISRILRCCNAGGRGAIMRAFKGNENAEARGRRLKAWATAWAQHVYPAEAMCSTLEAGAIFALAGAAYEAAAQPVKRVRLVFRQPLTSATAEPAAVAVAAPVAAAEPVAAAPEAAAPPPVAAMVVAADEAAEQQDPQLAARVAGLRRKLAHEAHTSSLLHREKLQLEKAVESAQQAAAKEAVQLRRQLRAAEKEKQQAAAAAAAKERELLAVQALRAESTSQLIEQTRVAQVAEAARADLEASIFRLEAAQALQARELEQAREELASCRKRQRRLIVKGAEEGAGRTQLEGELAAAKGAVLASKLAAAGALAEAEEEATAAAAKVQHEHAASLEREAAKTARLRAQLKEAQQLATEQAQLAANAASLQRTSDLQGRQLRRCREDLAAERQRRAMECAHFAKERQAFGLELEAARAQVEAMRTDVHAYKILKGKVAAKEAAQELSQRKEAEGSRRQMALRLERANRERAALLGARGDLQVKIGMLESEMEGSERRGRGMRPLQPTEADSSRRQLEVHNLKGGNGCFYDGFALEMFRRIVEECGVPFSAVPTANTLILALHMREVPPREMLLTDATVRNAFKKLGVLDAMRMHARNSSAPKLSPWAPAADAGEPQSSSSSIRC